MSRLFFPPGITALTILIKIRSLLLFYPAGASFMSQRGEREKDSERKAHAVFLSPAAAARRLRPNLWIQNKAGGMGRFTHPQSHISNPPKPY